MSWNGKKLVLGTALWGWGVDKVAAFDLLDAYASAGGRTVDTASNYPINGVAEDCGKAMEWLAEWCQQNPETTLSVLVKIGSLNNSGKPDFDLTPATIYRHESRLRDLFGDNLSAIAVHWDDRTMAEVGAIAETVGALADIKSRGLDIGLSGVKSPEAYLAAAPNLSSEWLIQVKENPLTCSARLAYRKSFPCAKYFAYGINMGGVKHLDDKAAASVTLRGISVPEELVERISNYIAQDRGIKPRLASIVEFSLALAVFNPNLHGLVIGPRNLTQLSHTIQFCQKIGGNSHLYSKICGALKLYEK